MRIIDRQVWRQAKRWESWAASCAGLSGLLPARCWSSWS